MRNPDDEPVCSGCGASGVDLHEIDRKPFCDDCSFECEGCGSRLLNSEKVDTEEGIYCKECVESDFSKCEGCEKIINTDDIVQTAEGLYCQQCVDDDFVTCENCERVVLSQNTDTVQPHDKVWCERCIERSATRCGSCNEHYDDDEETMIYLDDTQEHICQSCYDDSDAFYCDSCSSYYSNDSYGGSTDNGHYCTDCYEEEEGPVTGYHDHKRRWNRFGTAANGVYYGVELEAVNAPDYSDFAETADELVSKFGYIFNKEFLFTEDDSSLDDRGFETIMHPMSPDFIRENTELFKKILALMIKRNMVSYEAPNQGISAGMHITITWDPFTKVQKHKFLQLVFQNKELTTMISRRRQSDLDQYARVEAPAKLPAMALGKEGYGQKMRAVHLKDVESEDADYTKLAEVRIFRGTLKLESFLMNLEYVIACADFAMDIRFGFRDTTADKLLAYIEEKKKAYPHLYAWLKEKRLVK